VGAGHDQKEANGQAGAMVKTRPAILSQGIISSDKKILESPPQKAHFVMEIIYSTIWNFREVSFVASYLFLLNLLYSQAITI